MLSGCQEVGLISPIDNVKHVPPTGGKNYIIQTNASSSPLPEAVTMLILEMPMSEYALSSSHVTHQCVAHFILHEMKICHSLSLKSLLVIVVTL